VKKTLCCSLIILSSLITVKAQQHKIDSLTSVLNTVTNDTVKAGLLLERAKLLFPKEDSKAMLDGEQAFALYQESGQVINEVKSALFLGTIYNHQGKIKQALHLDSLAYNKAKQENYTSGMAHALANMSAINGRLGNLKIAVEQCLTAIEYAEDANFGKSDVASFYNKLGILYRKLSEYEKSLFYYDEGIALAEEIKHAKLLGVLYMNKGNTLTEVTRYDEAIENQLHSLAIKEKENDLYGIQQSYNNIANIYRRIGDNDKAYTYYKKALENAQTREDKTSLGLAYSNLSVVLIAMGKIDSVPYYFDKAIESFVPIGEPDKLGLVYHNYGKFHLDYKHYAEADKMLKKALDFRTRAKTPFYIASTKSALGQLRTKQNKFDEAESFLGDALKILENENGNLKQDVLSYLAELKNAKREYEKAYEYQQAYVALRDSTVKDSEVIAIARMESKYEIAKKQAELEIANVNKKLADEKIQNKNRQLYILLISAVVFFLIAILLFLNFRRKKILSKKLDQKNKQIEILMKELNHRVKNNLQLISSLLNIQSQSVNDDLIKRHFEAGRDRVFTIANMYDVMSRKNQDEQAFVEPHVFVPLLAEQLNKLYHSQLSITYDIRPIKLSSKKITAFGLILNELITNVIKHAFPEDISPKTLHIALEEINNEVHLSFQDNGKGFPENNIKSLGMQLVDNLVAQLKGKIKMDNNKGASVKIVFPF